MQIKSPIRVSISEAARLFGVSTTTIRNAVKLGSIKYVITRGRYRLDFESLTTWSQQSTRRQNQLAHKGIGQFVDRWRIHNQLYSPNPKLTEQEQTKNQPPTNWQPL
jgi:excisionase family DNA binding protein